MNVQDVRTNLEVVVCCKDGSEETLAYKDLAEKAALNSIGKLEAIEAVHLKIAIIKKVKLRSSISLVHGGYQAPSTICRLVC